MKVPIVTPVLQVNSKTIRAISHHDTPDNPIFELAYVAYILTPHLDSRSDPLTCTFQQDRIHGRIKDSFRGSPSFYPVQILGHKNRAWALTEYLCKRDEHTH